MGALELRGIPNPVRAHVVLGSTGVRGRLDSSAGGPALMIGRQQELTSLDAVLAADAARPGTGRADLGRRGHRQIQVGAPIHGVGDERRRRTCLRMVLFARSIRARPSIRSSTASEHHLGAERGAPRDRIGPRISDTPRGIRTRLPRRSRIWQTRRTSSSRWCLRALLPARRPCGKHRRFAVLAHELVMRSRAGTGASSTNRDGVGRPALGRPVDA